VTVRDFRTTDLSSSGRLPCATVYRPLSPLTTRPVQPDQARPSAIMTAQVPKFQTAAVVSKFGAKPDFRDDYPVPAPGDREVLAKVLYTGVCQSGTSHSLFFFSATQ
jgi:hypothetical protein